MGTVRQPHGREVCRSKVSPESPPLNPQHPPQPPPVPSLVPSLLGFQTDLYYVLYCFLLLVTGSGVLILILTVFFMFFLLLCYCHTRFAAALLAQSPKRLLALLLEPWLPLPLLLLLAAEYCPTPLTEPTWPSLASPPAEFASEPAA